MVNNLLILFFLHLLRLYHRGTFYVDASSLPSNEMQALHDVAKVLNKTNWNFNLDPCNDWTDFSKPIDNNVTCNCNIPNVVGCRVVMIVLKSQNLSGTLPADLSGLPYLRVLDLTRNYLSGSIPPQWGSTKLESISLLGNRLTGSIPKEIGNISTLNRLVLEYNKFSGSLPQELGNLSSIQSLLLTSNYFTGELPESTAKLTTLGDLRIADNPFTGRIPSFLQNLTNLTRLVIQGNNITGPIPDGIGLLHKMRDLRISDLVNGIESRFPLLGDMPNLRYLILRNCNIVGSLPNYWDKLTNLIEVDISFNKLTGELPTTFTQLSTVRYMFLTNNMFSGKTLEDPYDNYLDLSYNNFSEATVCQSQNTNFFSSSSMKNLPKTVSCSQPFECPSNKFYSMNINCGGPAIEINKVAYDEDMDSGSPSKFYKSKSNWAFSNTGNFIDNDNLKDIYIQTNTTPLQPSATSLYQTARTSPLSLTYHASCIMNGNYTVQLHFAEIKFTGDKSYMSLGRRLFNIFIQENIVLEDFNIENEAGGVGIPVVRNFNTSVVNNTLDIRFYWAGKGTKDIPTKGVWGPLISAIAVSPNFPVPSKRNGRSAPVLIGTVAGAIISFCLFLFLIWWAWIKKKDAAEEDLKELSARSKWFTFSQITAATMNFDSSNKIGEGGFGSVYKGILSDGTIIAVKQLSSVSKQGHREFINEIGMISALQHPNLVKLLGCCIEGSQFLLVYEYMENNSLARALYGPREYQLNLDWPTRLNICIGIARGLAYLHEETMVKVVHRDIKATNVLLDKDLNPKISDFGVAKLTEDDKTHVSTRVAGTLGYVAPEYAMRGHLSSKADVYSFGVVVLEIVSGKRNSYFLTHGEESLYLLDWALLLKKRGRLPELIDRKMGLHYNEEDVISVLNVALLCTSVSPALRPIMSLVVNMLLNTTTMPTRRPLRSDSLRSKHQIEAFDSVITPSTSNEGTSSEFLYPNSPQTAKLFHSKRSDSYEIEHIFDKSSLPKYT